MDRPHSSRSGAFAFAFGMAQKGLDSERIRGPKRVLIRQLFNYSSWPASFIPTSSLIARASHHRRDTGTEATKQTSLDCENSSSRPTQAYPTTKMSSLPRETSPGSLTFNGLSLAESPPKEWVKTLEQDRKATLKESTMPSRGPDVPFRFPNTMAKRTPEPPLTASITPEEATQGPEDALAVPTEAPRGREKASNIPVEALVVSEATHGTKKALIQWEEASWRPEEALQARNVTVPTEAAMRRDQEWRFRIIEALNSVGRDEAAALEKAVGVVADFWTTWEFGYYLD
ncbi:hypothetical protein B0H67DRAFT_93714 [Lasiosphaeris hirsuta]|uniref:Uncharacterized protein n=1 Tax=Lasiosphaeris hirsuta TaxID=260670 RepID=A0AA40EE81_9PEZI|nr:hypothetical protein B0H67DRAFT_93714 [Lasiosphaeris hirsuta]